MENMENLTQTEKRRRGRKPLFSQPMKHETVCLPHDYHAAIMQIGENNLSVGVRRLFEAYMAGTADTQGSAIYQS